jgi:pseudaminic acid cytidylyltransferase
MVNRIAIIPARGGSKRIPNKNIRDFCGQPMISYVLAAAKESGLFSKIHVSTESHQIASLVNELDFKVDFLRPSELADDHTPLMPVLKFVIEEFTKRGLNFDEVWLLMACSPNMRADDLYQASLLMNGESSSTSLVSISEYPVPIEWAFAREPTGHLIPKQPGMFKFRSQDLKPSFYDTGTFAVFSRTTVMSSNGAESNAKYIGYILPKGSAIDIDTEMDWIAAEAIYKANRT